MISRLKSVGRVNRQLFGFAADRTSPLAPGMPIYSSTLPDREAGIVTSVAYSPVAGRWIALGFLRRGTEMGELRAGENAPGAIPIILRETAYLQGIDHLPLVED